MPDPILTPANLIAEIRYPDLRTPRLVLCHSHRFRSLLQQPGPRPGPEGSRITKHGERRFDGSAFMRNRCKTVTDCLNDVLLALVLGRSRLPPPIKVHQQDDRFPRNLEGSEGRERAIKEWQCLGGIVHIDGNGAALPPCVQDVTLVKLDGYLEWLQRALHAR